MQKYKICVSGSAVCDACPPGTQEKAYDLGKMVAKEKMVLVTGATTGIPLEAAKGAKDAGGFSIGFSPASSEKEHRNSYRLPVDEFDLIIYTGFEYSGRNLMLIRASDAAIFICGRIGTLNEFTIAFEDKKPIGVLLGSGGTVDEIPHILETAKRGKKDIVFDTDPKKLLKKVIAMVKKRKQVETRSFRQKIRPE